MPGALDCRSAYAQIRANQGSQDWSKTGGMNPNSHQALFGREKARKEAVGAAAATEPKGSKEIIRALSMMLPVSTITQLSCLHASSSTCTNLHCMEKGELCSSVRTSSVSSGSLVFFFNYRPFIKSSRAFNYLFSKSTVAN